MIKSVIDYSKIDTGIPIKDYSVDSIKFSKFINTNYFREAARDYEYNLKTYGLGVYTRALVGSREFEEYWDLQTHRCLNGMKVGDLYITGRQYFYLNFFRILRSPSKEEKERNKVSGQIQKVEGFPSFWAIQWLWFSFTHIARYGGKFLGIDAGEGGLDVVALKTRGAGYSFMDACDDVYNYNFYRNSKSFIFAYSSNYLTGLDGIMPKIQVALNFLNYGTAGIQNDKTLSEGVWKKNRVDVAEEPMKFQSGYKTLGGDIQGFGSLIGGIIADNPRKIRAGRAMKLTLEEGGSFPNLLDIEASTQALVKDGSNKTGSRSLFGTGGEIGPGIEGLEKIFNNPAAFGFMGFPNIWEGEMDEVGFFCPSYMADAGVIDKDGNSDIAKHLEVQTKIREAKKKVSKAIEDKHTAEFPWIPSEALKRISGNIYDIAKIEAQIKKITFTNTIRHGELKETSDGKVQFNPLANANPILDFPHDQDKSLDGCITILQAPYEFGGKTPDDMYFIVVDNYGLDEAMDKTSLFSAYVYKYPNYEDNSYSSLPVAWYNARPESQEGICFPNLLKMSLFYGNAKIMGERNQSGQQIISYFKRIHKEDLLMDELEINKATTDDKRKKKPKFMIISTDAKRANLQGHAEYMAQTRYEVEGEEVDEDTKIITNYDCIYDIGYLLEMKKFNLNKGNFDRISANSMAPIIIKQRQERGIKALQERSMLSQLEVLSIFHNEDQESSELISEY